MLRKEFGDLGKSWCQQAAPQKIGTSKVDTLFVHLNWNFKAARDQDLKPSKHGTHPKP